jgi:hypothetical protein
VIKIWTATLTGIDSGGFYAVQRSGHGGEEASLTPDRLYHAYGFIGRCNDPDTNGDGATVAYASAGSRENIAWLLNDPRDVSRIPPVKKGGSCQYASDGSFSSFGPETHTWTVYVPYSSSPAKAHLVTIGKDGNDTPIIELASGEGPSITLLDKVTTLKNADGSAYVVLDDDGTSIVGPFKAAGGADIGGPSSLPLVKFPPLSTELTAVQNALTMIGAALTAVAAGTTNPPAVATPVANAIQAIVQALSALAVFTTAGPTLTTKGA